MPYPAAIDNAPLDVKQSLQIMQCNSCVKVDIKEDCSTIPCTKNETRIRCPVYKVKNKFTLPRTPQVCRCPRSLVWHLDNPSPDIGDVCSNGEPTPWYTPEDFVRKNENGYCLGNDGYLDPGLTCDDKDKRAPFEDCPDCTEGKYL